MAWFMLAAAYVLVVALRQAGVDWWLIFSLSGHGASISFLLVSAYLYALFRDNGRDPQRAVEHPLTNTRQYMTMYSLIPFLGASAGLYSVIDLDSAYQIAMTIAMGTLGATFVFWIIADPAISFSEMLLPESRKHRLARHALAQAAKEQKQRNREQLLADITAEEKIRNQQLRETLSTESQKLAALIIKAIEGSASAGAEAVEIGLHAWQQGGLNGMQRLREMACEACHDHGGRHLVQDYISIWWDGIGQWRHKLVT
jgi:hypothetical protein